MRNDMGKLLHKLKTYKNIPIYAAAVMLCMTLLSTYFVAGLYARYSTGEENINEARVAKFSITGDGTLLEPIEAELAPGDSLEEVLNIHNNSEVAVEYTISVTNVTNILPLHFSMTKADSAPDLAADGTTFTAQQLPGSHTDQYTLHIDWAAADNDPALMGLVDYITVTVTATQID